MDNVKVSIIIPAYNVEKYILKCINSLLEQTEKEIEIIVVDDGSKDKTNLIVKEIIKKHANIVLIEQENKGVSAARNAGLQNAKGKYTMFIDADDWLEKDAIENLYKTAETESYELIRFEKVIELPYKRVASNPIFEEENITPQDLQKKFLEVGSLNSVCLNFTLSKLIQDNKIVFNDNLKFAEDMIFILDLITNAKKVKYLPNAYYHYEYNFDNVSNNINIDSVKMKIKDGIYSYGKIFDYIKRWNLEYEEKKVALKLLKMLENELRNFLLADIKNKEEIKFFCEDNMVQKCFKLLENEEIEEPIKILANKDYKKYLHYTFFHYTIKEKIKRVLYKAK